MNMIKVKFFIFINTDFSTNELEEDYNSKIYKLHCSLKYKSEEIENTNDKDLIRIYYEILDIIYEILINNNVIYILIFKLNKIISTNSSLSKS